MELESLYGVVDVSKTNDVKFDYIVTLGGDGVMLRVLHKYISSPIPIFGMNKGSLGFLLNQYHSKNLIERIEDAVPVDIHPLEMRATTTENLEMSALAINEVSLLRQLHQAAKIKVYIDGKMRLKELVSDGILVSTPAGSSAYNYAAGGSIIPLSANVIALTPISPFRPRNWRGALLSNKSIVEMEVLEFNKRPVSAVADFTAVRNVVMVKTFQRTDIKLTILSDKENKLEDKILQEQFYIY